MGNRFNHTVSGLIVIRKGDKWKSIWLNNLSCRFSLGSILYSHEYRRMLDFIDWSGIIGNSSAYRCITQVLKSMGVFKRNRIIVCIIFLSCSIGFCADLLTTRYLRQKADIETATSAIHSCQYAAWMTYLDIAEERSVSTIWVRNCISTLHGTISAIEDKGSFSARQSLSPTRLSIKYLNDVYTFLLGYPLENAERFQKCLEPLWAVDCNNDTDFWEYLDSLDTYLATDEGQIAIETLEQLPLYYY